MSRQYFQDFMPGDLCFGCGADNPYGLRIKSYWEGDEAICRWQPQLSHQGWGGVTCGGIIATLIDCHCMATAMAHAIRLEKRELDSKPYYRFATGELKVRYLNPTPIEHPIELKARVTEIKNDRKYTLSCDVSVNDELTAQGEVVAFLAWRSDEMGQQHAFTPDT